MHYLYEGNLEIIHSYRNIYRKIRIPIIILLFNLYKSTNIKINVGWNLVSYQLSSKNVSVLETKNVDRNQPISKTFTTNKHQDTNLF